MIAVVLATGLVVVSLGFIWLLDRRDKRADAERQNLLERIQRPEMRPVEPMLTIPPAPGTDDQLPDDEWDKVGTVDGWTPEKEE